MMTAETCYAILETDIGPLKCLLEIVMVTVINWSLFTGFDRVLTMTGRHMHSVTVLLSPQKDIHEK